MTEERKRIYEIKKAEIVAKQVYLYVDKIFKRLSVDSQEVEDISWNMLVELHDVVERNADKLSDLKEERK